MLTASEVYELTRHWPERAKAPIGYTTANGGGWVQVDGADILPGLAADLHALAGLRWLAKYNYEAVVSPLGSSPSSDDRGWSVLTDRAYEGPTLLHAVSAAVLAVKG